jgi:hypothetical protein
MKTIVSFTTIPSRISKVQPMVDSILNQTLDPDEIILWVNETYKRVGVGVEIPKFISNSRIRVEYCEDLGPFTKLKYALDEFWEAKDTNVVTADDDVFYPPTWLEKLVEMSERNQDAAIGYRGRTLMDKNAAFIKYNSSRLYEGAPIGRPLMKVDIITGTWGALYKPRFFDDDVFNEEVSQEAFFVDDIWISGNLAMNGVDRIVIPNVGVEKIRTISNIDSLWSINKNGGNNDTMCTHFRKFW